MREQKVSIVVASYNSRKFIDETLTSIINQSYVNWECIIIDDCSNDGSKEIIYKYLKTERRFRLIENQVNLGAGKSRNIGISEAAGKFLTFIDADDIWKKNHLKKQISFMEDNDLEISHSNYGYIDTNSIKVEKVFRVSSKSIGFKDLLVRPEMSCLATIIDISKTGKLYMSEDRRRQDYYLWLSMLKKGYKSKGFDNLDCYYRQHGNQPKKNLKYIYDHFVFLRKRIGLDLINSLTYTIIYSTRGAFKYMKLGIKQNSKNN